MSRPALSRHLRVLRQSGLVEVDTLVDDARGRLYKLRPTSLVALQAWLDQVPPAFVDRASRPPMPPAPSKVPLRSMPRV